MIEQGKIGQILSSRPAERRALIEEAAGVTKYKSRRRAAELKLEAAQQNLTRIDDIIFEVEKQRGALKRQAARARRYQAGSAKSSGAGSRSSSRTATRRWPRERRGRRERGWTTRARARPGPRRTSPSSKRRSRRLRLGLTEAEAGATTTREQAHARELEIGRRQQQIQFDKQQIEELARQAEIFAVEARDLEGRRDPANAAIDTQREAAARVRQALAEAAARVDRLRSRLFGGADGRAGGRTGIGYHPRRRPGRDDDAWRAATGARQRRGRARPRGGRARAARSRSARARRRERARARRATNRRGDALDDARDGARDRRQPPRGRRRRAGRVSASIASASVRRLPRAAASWPAKRRVSDRSKSSTPAARRSATPPGSSSPRPVTTFARTAPSPTTCRSNDRSSARSTR